MRKRKLYLLLARMDADDLDGFADFLASPMFNNSKTLLGFFELWRGRVLEAEDAADLSVEQFLSGTGIAAGRMDKLSSQLNSKAMEYLALRAFQENAHAQEEMLLTALEKRNMAPAELMRVHARMEKKAGKAAESSEKWLHLLRLGKIAAQAAVSMRETRVLWQENFQELHDWLDQYYQTEKLLLVSASSNIARIYKQKGHFPGHDYLNQLGEVSDRDKFPALAQAYYWVTKMLGEGEEERGFQQLLDLLGRHATTFAHAHAGELYGYALNYCIARLNGGQLEYLASVSEIYLQLLDNGLLLDGGILRPKQFKNLIVVQCRLGRLAWVREFIDQEKEKLPEDKRAAALNYNEAVLSFYQRDYGAAIQQFREVIAEAKDDVFYGIDARAYLWKSYYEHLAHLSVMEVDEMFKLYDAFRIYIDRNDKISAAHKTHYRNFIRVFKRILELTHQNSGVQEKLHALREEVTDLEAITDKGWILEKIDEALGK